MFPLLKRSALYYKVFVIRSWHAHGVSGSIRQLDEHGTMYRHVRTEEWSA